MVTMNLELSEETVETARRAPDEFVRELRFRVAVELYHRAEVSQERAAEIAGMTRMDFLDELASRELDVVILDIDELRREIERG
jgi:predicted HTH domain antitoxin